MTYYGTLGGKYYHTNSKCSNLKNPLVYTKQAAENEGKEPCPVCVTKTQKTLDEEENDNTVFVNSSTNDSSGIYVYATKGGEHFHVNEDLEIVRGSVVVCHYPGRGSIGAFVGRYANRICGGSFRLNGKTYQVTQNEGKNTLHGGRGYHLRTWKLERTDRGAALSLFDPDGEEGFPGNVNVRIDVSLTDRDELIFDYTATTDADTVINLTNHSYFNLSGKEQILDQELYLNSDSYLEVDSGLIPTGKRIDVSGTEFDFRTRRPITSGQYDHCFILNPGEVQADAWDPASGRGMRMTTDQPTVQLYCGGGLGGTKGKQGRIYKPFAGFCLETQHYPDSPNHEDFPSTILRAGEVFHTITKYAFYVE